MVTQPLAILYAKSAEAGGDVIYIYIYIYIYICKYYSALRGRTARTDGAGGRRGRTARADGAGGKCGNAQDLKMEMRKSTHFNLLKLLLRAWDLIKIVALEICCPVAGWIFVYDQKTGFTSRVQGDNKVVGINLPRLMWLCAVKPLRIPYSI